MTNALKEKHAHKNGKHHHKGRLEKHTAPQDNSAILQETRINIASYAHKSDKAIEKRLAELDKEWDAQRVLQTNASILAGTGLALGVFVDRKWLALPAMVAPFLLQNAIQGWCPPLPVIRKMGVRTQREIDAERYALKALRGDFEHVKPDEKPRKIVGKVLAAIFS